MFPFGRKLAEVRWSPPWISPGNHSLISGTPRTLLALFTRPSLLKLHPKAISILASGNVCFCRKPSRTGGCADQDPLQGLYLPKAIDKKGDQFIFDSAYKLHYWRTPDNAESSLVRGGAENQASAVRDLYAFTHCSCTPPPPTLPRNTSAGTGRDTGNSCAQGESSPEKLLRTMRRQTLLAAITRSGMQAFFKFSAFLSGVALMPHRESCLAQLPPCRFPDDSHEPQRPTSDHNIG